MIQDCSEYKNYESVCDRGEIKHQGETVKQTLQAEGSIDIRNKDFNKSKQAYQVSGIQFTVSFGACIRGENSRKEGEVII